MPYIEVKDIYGREFGVGVGGGVGSANKNLTNQAFIEPMQKLATSLESLHKALKARKCILACKTLQKDVTGDFNKIVDIVGYTGCPTYGSEDDDDQEDDE